MDKLPLVGFIEICMHAGVRRPVPNSWIARYEDFPAPVADLIVGKIFWWPEVEQWLRRTGRRTDADWTREQVVSGWESQHRVHQVQRKRL